MTKICNKRFLYHATPLECEENILEQGVLLGFDNLVYLAETEEDALKFMALRLNVSNVSVMKIKVSQLRQECLAQSWDHNKDFFKCNAWTYSKIIPCDSIVQVTQYMRKEK